MPQLNVGQTGSLKSIPKLTKINGDDNAKAIYRNLGNNHAYPFLWASEITISGTEVVVASGIKWHGYDLATYANVTITPLADPGANRLWVDKDTATNVIKIKSSASQNNLKIDVKFMLGEELEIVGLYCRGNNGATPSLP